MRSIEFTVTGPPMSAQSQNRDRLRAWQLRVREAARAVYSDAPTKDRDLEVSVTCYHDSTSPRLDGDNMVKPILDALQGTVFVNDRQVVSQHNYLRDLNGPFIARGMPLVLAIAFAAGDEFIHIAVRNTRNMTEVPR